jgi:hypothetical protein
MPTIARRALAVFLALHGVAHLAGTSDVFARASDGRSVDWLGGAWTVADPLTLRAFGAVWALVAAAYVAVALVTWAGRPGWVRALLAVTAASLVLVTVALWTSVVGLVIGVALLAGAAAARARGALDPGRDHVHRQAA